MKLFKKSEAMGIPRREYKEGKLKLDFEYKFKNEDVLRATEDEVGIATVVIERDGQMIVDFKDLLPEGYTFATPSYAVANSIKRKLGQNWVSRENRLVFLGDIRTPQDIFILLHEIGHTKQESWEGLAEKINEINKVDRVRAEKEVAVRLSALERDAWARAIKLAREIKREKGIDFFGSYKNFEELKEVIYSGLISHRYWREDVAKSGYGFSKEDMKIFEDLFDKGKFGHDRTGSPEEA